jgi:rubrerythrin
MPVSQVRARRGSGPEDRALYGCECGFAWTGEVTASPSCPHCGQPQAW